MWCVYQTITCVNICIININELCVPLAVVSLNDTEELSSTEEEEEEEAEEAEEEDEEEDSGSEVEIIEEIKGNGTQQHLYLQELHPEDEFLQEQAAAVLSLVTDPQLKVRHSSHGSHVTNKSAMSWFSFHAYAYFIVSPHILFVYLFIVFYFMYLMV